MTAIFTSAKASFSKAPLTRGFPPGTHLSDALRELVQQPTDGDAEMTRSRAQLQRELGASVCSVYALTKAGRAIEVDPRLPLDKLPAEVLVPQPMKVPGGQVVEVFAVKVEVQSYQAVG